MIDINFSGRTPRKVNLNVVKIGLNTNILLKWNVEALLFLKYNLRAVKHTASFPEVPKDFIPPNSISVIENEVLDNDLIDFCGFN